MWQGYLAYLESVRSRLRLGLAAEQEILRELKTHLEERIQELKAAGLTEAEAEQRAIQSLGPPQALARELFLVHSRCNWAQAAMAALPHLFFATLFALHLWQNPVWLLIFALLTVAIVLYGWDRGKPPWLFPWLGYSILILLGGSLVVLALPPWTYLAILVYIPFSWWLLSRVAMQAVRRDWLYGSLMLLPLPVSGVWLLAFLLQGKAILGGNIASHLDLWIALSFLVLALTAATFMRLRRRQLKAGALLTPELLISVMVSVSTGGALGLPGLLMATLFSEGLLISPVLLERRVRHGQANP